MSVKHPFVSSVVDVGGGTYVQPTHWNAPHNNPPFLLYNFFNGLAVGSFGIPSTAGPTGMEFPRGEGNLILREGYDFTYVDSLYMAVTVSSQFALGSTALRLQYMPSGFPASWYSFDATGGSGPFVTVASGNNASLFLQASNGMRWGPTVAVSAAAKALPQPLSFRVAGYGGNGSGLIYGTVKVFGF